MKMPLNVAQYFGMLFRISSIAYVLWQLYKRYIIVYVPSLLQLDVPYVIFFLNFDLISGPSTSGHMWPSGLYIVNLYCLHESHLK